MIQRGHKIRKKLQSFALLGLLMGGFACQPASPTQVKVTGGVVDGVIENGLRVYKGIPFAAPPVGELRWKAPQPVEPWEGVHMADKFAPPCPQMSFSYPGTKKPETSEDCLYLNIWSPAQKAHEKLPVMVWIYGGGFAMGTASDQSAYGDVLAQHGVITVNIAYRVGALGFMAHPELTAESDQHISGNYGLQDQIAGLKWVQENIAQFGGDPDNVTIFGESAGGISVSMLCASPLTKGLFKGAISQSGGSFGPAGDDRIEGGIQTLAAAEKTGLEFMERMGVSSLSELRQLPAEAWEQDPLSAMGGFWPVVDGYVIADDQYKLYEKGQYNDIPVLIGTNSDEGVFFTQGTTLEKYKTEINERFGPLAEQVLKAYPATTDEETHAALADIFRESAFAWPTYAWANLQSQTGESDVYLYYFDRQQPKNPYMPFEIRGAGHGNEIPYVFGHLSQNKMAQYTEADHLLSEQMVQYWTNFAKTGNPNGENLPQWPVYEPGKATVMQLNENPQAIAMPNETQLETMEAFFKYERTGELK